MPASVPIWRLISSISRLPSLSLGWALPDNDHLKWKTSGDVGEPAQIREQQLGPLVARHSARERDQRPFGIHGDRRSRARSMPNRSRFASQCADQIAPSVELIGANQTSGSCDQCGKIRLIEAREAFVRPHADMHAVGNRPDVVIQETCGSWFPRGGGPRR